MSDFKRYDRTSLEAFLTSHRLDFTPFDHPAVFTVAEADLVTGHLPGMPTKNLFLRDGKGNRHILVVVRHDQVVDLRNLSELLNIKHLSFASPERLERFLGVAPGSVTLFGLINDPHHAVECFIERSLWEAEALQCHPLANTATFLVPQASVRSFLELIDHPPTVIDLLKDGKDFL